VISAANAVVCGSRGRRLDIADGETPSQTCGAPLSFRWVPATLRAPTAGPAPTGLIPAPAYQFRVDEPESRCTVPVISGRSNTDWTATRPGPCSSSHTVLACQRAELNP
jgi:hypothetical protein